MNAVDDLTRARSRVRIRRLAALGAGTALMMLLGACAGAPADPGPTNVPTTDVVDEVEDTGPSVGTYSITERVAVPELLGDHASIQELDGQRWLVTDKVAILMNGATLDCATATCITPPGDPRNSFTLPLTVAADKFFRVSR